MKEVLDPYAGRKIGINWEHPFKIESAELVATAQNYFTVRDGQKGYIHHFSYMSIVQVIENPEGIEVGGLFSHKERFTLVVKVGHLVEYIPG